MKYFVAEDYQEILLETTCELLLSQHVAFERYGSGYPLSQRLKKLVRYAIDRDGQGAEAVFAGQDQQDIVAGLHDYALDGTCEWRREQARFMLEQAV